MTTHSNEALCMMLDSCTFDCDACAYNHQTKEERKHQTGYISREELREKYPWLIDSKL